MFNIATSGDAGFNGKGSTTNSQLCLDKTSITVKVPPTVSQRCATQVLTL